MNSTILSLIDESRGITRKLKLTSDQIDFIVLCREHSSPVPYAKMAKIWNEKLQFPKLSSEQIRKHHLSLTEQQINDALKRLKKK